MKPFFKSGGVQVTNVDKGNTSSVSNQEANQMVEKFKKFEASPSNYQNFINNNKYEGSLRHTITEKLREDNKQ